MKESAEVCVVLNSHEQAAWGGHGPFFPPAGTLERVPERALPQHGLHQDLFLSTKIDEEGMKDRND